MGNIFISYSHKDSKYVRKLEKDIKQKGLDVWIDERIDYGTEWPKVIQEHLDECEAFIVVVSENSFNSLWVQNELARAQRKGKPFFPLLLSGDPWLSTETTQYVDVKGGKLPPPKFYERLSKVVTRGKKTSTQQSDNQPNLTTVTGPSKPSQAGSGKRFSFSRHQLILGIPIIFVIIATVAILSYLLTSKIPFAGSVATAFAQTQIVIAQASAPTPTNSPAINDLIKILNDDLSSANPIGWVVDVQYYVSTVKFLNGSNGSDQIVQVNVDCVCMNDTNCCTPERTFTAIVEAMRRNSVLSLQAFGGVKEFRVVCLDLQTKETLGTMSTSWQDVQNYLTDPSSAYELGGHLIETVVP